MKTRISTLLIVMALVLAVSCRKDDADPLGLLSQTPLLKEGDLSSSDKDVVTLGRQLSNPYSVSNMQTAYRNLVNNGAIQDIYTIQATHYYVRILPRDTMELNKLVDDTSLTLFTYPLDYELIGTGEYIPPENEDPWLYTVVPVTYPLSRFGRYDILQSCYIPDIDNNTDMEALEYEAFDITGNVPRDNSVRGCSAPSGYIKVYNTTTQNEEGVRNIQVCMNTFVRIGKVNTNTVGHFVSTKKFLFNVNYTLIYHNPVSHFQVWGNLLCFSPALYILGVHSNQNYSKSIDTTYRAWYWSTINNAASIYYERLCPDFGILKPPVTLRIAAVNMGGDWTGNCPMLRHWNCVTYGMTPGDIFLYYLGASPWTLDRIQPDVFILKNKRRTDKIYSTVFHELAHASHYSLVGGTYWSNFVRHVILNQGYGSPNGDLAGYVGVGEMWAYFVEPEMFDTCWRRYYNDTNVQQITNLHLEDEWFHPIALKMVHDSLSISYDSIFNCLTATSIPDLKVNLSRAGEDDFNETLYRIFNSQGL